MADYLCSLPEELWIHITIFSTLEALDALTQTCRSLRSALLKSYTVWSSVVRDLLLISPNIRVQQTLSNMTSEELRTLATHYYTFNIMSPLSSKGSGRIVARTYAATAWVRQIRFMPTGAPFAIWISTQATVHLWDLRTGNDASMWEPSNYVHYIHQAWIDFWNCEDWASCVFLVSVAISELPGAPYQWKHWLFWVDGLYSSNPVLRLGAVLADRIDRHFGSGDTLIATWLNEEKDYLVGRKRWRDDSDMNTAHIDISDFDAVWRLPSVYHNFIENSTRYPFAISRNTFCILCMSHLAIFRLPTGEVGSASQDSPSILEPIWLYDYDGQDLLLAWQASSNVYVRTFALNDDSTYLELAKKDFVLTVRIPRPSPNRGQEGNVSVEIVEKRIPFSDAVDVEGYYLEDHTLLSLRFSSTHVCTTSGPNMTATRATPALATPPEPTPETETEHGIDPQTRDTRVRVDLIPRPLLPVARHMAKLRLGLSTGMLPPRALRAQIGPCYAHTISHDAWSGDLLLAWGHEDPEEDDSTYVTVLGLRS